MGIFSDILLTVDYDRTLTGPDSSIPERTVVSLLTMLIYKPLSPILKSSYQK